MARIFLEQRDMGDDPRQAIRLIEAGSMRTAAAGECSLPLDVVETDKGIEVIVDVPGVIASSITLLFSRNTLVIGGQKGPAACEHHAAAFHLAERSFGHFARAVRLSGAYDAGAARATLAAGELRIVLPRIDDRRGAEIRIPIQAN